MEVDPMARPEAGNPVEGFVKVAYGKRAGDKRSRRAGERILARHGMRLVFEDEQPTPDDGKREEGGDADGRG